MSGLAIVLAIIHAAWAQRVSHTDRQRTRITLALIGSAAIICGALGAMT